MMGSFISRILIMVLGYAYPAYECFKEVENKMPEIEQLLFWCHYWILVASFAFLERIGDSLISWLPLYNEAKLAFLIYLWHPKTKGTRYIYNCFMRPFLAKHMTEIDRNLWELKLDVGRYALVYWQMALSCGQSKFFEILENISSHSSTQQVTINQEDQSVRHEDKQEQSPEGESELENETKQMLNEDRKPSLNVQEEALKESVQQIPGLWRLFQTKEWMPTESRNWWWKFDRARTKASRLAMRDSCVDVARCCGNQEEFFNWNQSLLSCNKND